MSPLHFQEMNSPCCSSFTFIEFSFTLFVFLVSVALAVFVLTTQHDLKGPDPTYLCSCFSFELWFALLVSLCQCCYVTTLAHRDPDCSVQRRQSNPSLPLSPLLVSHLFMLLGHVVFPDSRTDGTVVLKGHNPALFSFWGSFLCSLSTPGPIIRC